MIVSTIVNCFNSFGAKKGQKPKLVGPLEVMGYDAEEGGASPSRPQSQAELALRMRIMAAAQKRSGGAK